MLTDSVSMYSVCPTTKKPKFYFFSDNFEHKESNHLSIDKESSDI